MDKQQDNSQLTPRENFLMSLLHKIIKEYKALLELTRRTKPYKIVEIIHLSTIPGDTKFGIQITNKNSVLQLSAAEIISYGYDLTDFNDFHAEMIRQAGQGKLMEFLKISEPAPHYKITAKKLNQNLQQYVFTIETPDQQSFTHTADEIAANKTILGNLSFQDVHDIGYTQGSESILKEKMLLMFAKNQKKSLFM